MGKNRVQFWFLSIISSVFFGALLATIILNSELDLNIRLSPLAIIPAVSVTASTYLLVTIIRRKKYIKSAIWLALFITSSIFWSTIDMLTFLGADAKTSLFIRSFIVVPALVGSCAMLIFTSDVTSDDTEKLLGPRVIMLITTLFYLVVALTTNLIFVRDPAAMIPRFWGWEVLLGSFAPLYLAWGNIIILSIGAVTFKYYRTRKRKDQKKQARIFLLSVFIPVAGIMATNIIPGYLGLPWMPMDSLFITMMAALMVYGINKYQLFIIDPSRISNNILETMTESVVVTDPTLNLQYLNKNAMLMLGVGDPSESEEQSLEEFLSKEDYYNIKKHSRDKAVTKSSKKFSDLEIRPKGGSKPVPVEMSLSSIVLDGKKSVGFVFVISDVSELQKAYSQLAEQEQKVEKQVQERTKQLYEEHAKLEASISGLPIGFIMLDESMKVVEQNEVAQKLFSTRENNWWYVQDALEELGVEKRLLKKVAQDEIIDIPEVVKGNRFLHIIISPIVSEGKILGRVILIEDITEQKAAERERNEFVVTASHEIRTPLSVIQGNLSNALDMGSKVGNDAKPLIETAYGASNQISALFNDILIVSDIENPTNPKPKYETVFKLNDAIQEVVDRLSPSAEKKKLDLKFKRSGTAKLSADRDEIKESIFKLVDNAIKFTKKGSVEIKVSSKGPNVEIKITDSGKGISKEEEKRLFRKFIRLDNSLKREVGGTGLGLYIAKALAERNGGGLELTQSSAKGSTFSLVLPLAK